ncbi:LamG domain-containing protein [Aquibium sp. A9E412]|uniref:N,N-dimethylformamidase beta subunit family domain-containing protein n=1 Tax=Aquibium sp. A9E412 TaxID=2976767 RepID=UPI0025B1AD28|nr:N,N-dimethylformamidase beta subunit family domain-containing protein [Aquibium sp. A9E412]MDN2564860.1 LamG domain-containing protein [Aquibium sp. A9E412]
MSLAPDFGITGYTDRWTARPGERVALHLSADAACRADVRLHRFRRLEPRDGALELVADPVALPPFAVDVAPQTIALGSRFEAALPAGTLPAGGFTLAMLVRPTALDPRGNGLCALDCGAARLALSLAADGRLVLALGAGAETPLRLVLSHALPVGHWSRLALAVDPAGGVALATLAGRRTHAAALETAAPSFAAAGRLTLAADGGADGLPTFNGRIEAPMLLVGAGDPAAAFARLDAFAASGEAGPGAIAAWDFARHIDTARAADVAGGHDGRLVNLPMRAVKGVRWSGREQSWVHAPRDYAAVHFHQDDLADAGWPAAGHLALPDDLESGLYLIEVAGPAGRDTLPVFVEAKRRGERAALAFLAPTFTYLAYANDRCLLHGANPEVLAGRLLALTAGDVALAAHPEYGLSLYDTHADGSGVAYASRRRPCLTLRHTQRAWQGALGSGLWNFSADLLILTWLDREGLACEIVSDDTIDAEGAAALAPYRCVLTGSHPEYHTAASLDAVDGFLDGGGRLIYLGGNGFYWRVAVHAGHPETIELRRAEDGNRSWASEPGEYYHAFDGAYGGLWRRNGRPPQATVGVGYTGQGFLRCHPYRVAAAAADPRAAFLFGGAPPAADTPLGDFGLSGGGAAGIEIDRADGALGTPEHALTLASAGAMDDSYLLANEEVLVNRPTVVGRLSPLLRADLVFFETAAGGAVLSTGSVAWAGSLGDPRPDNDVARLTRNAVDRFLDPAPFVPPQD